MLSFTDFYIKNWGKVFGYCKKILKNAALAEEAAQQSFEKAFKAWDKLDSDNALSWILRVSHNVCVDIIRKEDRSVPFAEIIIPEEENIGAALMKEAIEKVKTFDLKYRQVFELSFIYGYKNREIAEILQLPLTTVKRRLNLCMQKLRNIIS